MASNQAAKDAISNPSAKVVQLSTNQDLCWSVF